MKQIGCTILAAMLVGLLVVGQPGLATPRTQPRKSSEMNRQEKPARSYASVNGLKLYYEIHGSGKPIVLLHGGGSTIESTSGRILPELAKTHQIVAIELQAHGHTKDIDRPLSFEQDADDVASTRWNLRAGCRTQSSRSCLAAMATTSAKSAL
jgi:hypothetical protein